MIWFIVLGSNLVTLTLGVWYAYDKYYSRVVCPLKEAGLMPVFLAYKAGALKDIEISMSVHETYMPTHMMNCRRFAPKGASFGDENHTEVIH